MIEYRRADLKWHHKLVRGLIVYGIMAGIGLMGAWIFFATIGL
jgi:hypothetical protein